MNDKFRYDKNGEHSCCDPCRPDRESGMCCIDTYRILDSCRSQDCVENARVYFTDAAQDVVNRSSSYRTKSARVLWTQIDTTPAPFQSGYYNVGIRYYFYTLIDCCLGLGNTQEVQGLAIYDKTLILYGGEGNVATFQSDGCNGFCGSEGHNGISLIANLPRVVVEATEPIPLKLDVLDSSCPCPAGAAQSAFPDPLPTLIEGCFHGCFSTPPQADKALYITLGLFSIVRIERPSQLVIPACDDCIPPSSCGAKPSFTDPCSLFRSMEFPLKEFFPTVANEEPRHCCGEEAMDPKEYR